MNIPGLHKRHPSQPLSSDVSVDLAEDAADLTAAANLLAPRGLPPHVRFAADLEAKFRSSQDELYRPICRTVLWIAVVLYICNLVLDSYTFDRLSEDWVYRLLWFVAMPANALGAITSQCPPLRQHFVRINTFVALCNGLPLAAVMVLGAPAAGQVAYNALVLHYLYSFFFLGFFWQRAMLITLCSYAIGVIGEGFVSKAAELRFDHIYFLGSVIAVGAVASYMLESSQRQSWLQNRRLKHLSNHDSLTGLLNHREFYQRGEQVLRQARRDGKDVALLFADLDHFKRFNDQHGHLLGDECIRQCATVMLNLLRRPLDLIGRLGGEEFGLLLYDTDQKWALGCAEQLRSQVEKLILGECPAPPGRVTVSVGVTFSVSHEPATMTELVNRADSALYKAKTDGRNRAHL